MTWGAQPALCADTPSIPVPKPSAGGHKVNFPGTSFSEQLYAWHERGSPATVCLALDLITYLHQCAWHWRGPPRTVCLALETLP